MTQATKTYEPSPLCAECKGKCCQRMACHYAPDDFRELSFEGLKTEIEKEVFRSTGGKASGRSIICGQGMAMLRWLTEVGETCASI